MNAMDLINALGSVRDSYICAAAEFREGTQPQTGRLRLNRVWLIAAIIALTLLLVGCTVAYVLSLKDMKIGEQTVVEASHYGPNWEVVEEKQITREILSLQGFTDSPNQRAAREWRDFKENYDVSYRDAPIAAQWVIPDNYTSTYGCYTQEMADKLDEIVEKHGLTLLSDNLNIGRGQHQVLFDALKIPPICSSSEKYAVEFSSGHFYPEGSFGLSVDISLNGDNNQWPYPIWTSFSYSKKAYFDDIAIGVENLDSFQEWEYPLPDGNTALIALSDEDALIFVDQEDAFLSITFDSRAGIDHMTAEMVEEIATLFDFTIRPQEVSPGRMAESQAVIGALEAEKLREYNQWQEEYQESLRKEGFAEWVRELLGDGNTVSADLGFAFWDLDGNGTDELFIGRDGYATMAFIERDGKVEQISNALFYLYPCEDNKLVGSMGLGTEAEYYFTKWSDGTSEGEYHTRYVPGHPEGEYWQYSLSLWNQYDYISKEEFDSILNSYTRIPLKFIPLTEYPLDVSIVPTAEAVLGKEPYSSYAEKIRIRLTDQEERWPRWEYDLRDLDGNGQEEMIWTEDGRFFVYTIVNGSVQCYPLAGNVVTVCEDGFVESVNCYGPENRTYRFYRIHGAELELVEYLRYDVDADPDNPYFRSPDLSGQDVSLEAISMEEFYAILAAYPPMELDMKPITEYPLD